MIVRFKRSIPAPVRRAIRLAQYFGLDQLDVIRRQRDPVMPPRSRIFTGTTLDYRKVGAEFLGHFVKLGHLTPDDRVLDIGSGDGRMARALTSFLSPAATYEGIEIVKWGVDWCQHAISSRYPNFRFQHADIYNQLYNPGGATPAAQYRFPFDTEFDFVFLTSIFTHMLPDDYRNYLDEIARVLKPGGRCLITMFLINAESKAAIAAGKSQPRFRHAFDGLLLDDPNIREAAVAYPEDEVVRDFMRRGLNLEPIRYGSWCARDRFTSFQDILIASKGAAVSQG